MGVPLWFLHFYKRQYNELSHCNVLLKSLYWVAPQSFLAPSPPSKTENARVKNMPAWSFFKEGLPSILLHTRTVWGIGWCSVYNEHLMWYYLKVWSFSSMVFCHALLHIFSFRAVLMLLLFSCCYAGTEQSSVYFCSFYAALHMSSLARGTHWNVNYSNCFPPLIGAYILYTCSTQV